VGQPVIKSVSGERRRLERAPNPLESVIQSCVSSMASSCGAISNNSKTAAAAMEEFL
jgi:hypothetical protein